MRSLQKRALQRGASDASSVRMMPVVAGLEEHAHTKVDQRPGDVPIKASRIHAIDFTKGTLVLLMVLYHWINYFVGGDWPYYRYLRFLTPSFIVVSGFLISNVHLWKYKTADKRLSMRLLTRGVKLLILFLLLNLGRMALLPMLSHTGIAHTQLSLRAMIDVFVSGDVTGNLASADSKAVAFYILVPIGYLLLLSAGLVLLRNFYRYVFQAACVFGLGCVAVLSLAGIQSYNLEFLTIGLVGVAIGFLPLATINRLVVHPYWMALAYAGYLVAISLWNVPFPLLIVGACLSLGVIYLVGLGSSEHNKAVEIAVLLGKYSLFGYVIQIAILQFLSFASRFAPRGYVSLAISFAAAFALTCTAVILVDRGRARSAAFDWTYRAVFA